MADATYDEIQVDFGIGDTLVMASDGAFDAINRDGQMFNQHLFVEAMQKNAAQEISLFVKSLFLSITAFAGDVELADDITIVALRRTR